MVAVAIAPGGIAVAPFTGTEEAALGMVGGVDGRHGGRGPAVGGKVGSVGRGKRLGGHGELGIVGGAVIGRGSVGVGRRQRSSLSTGSTASGLFWRGGPGGERRARGESRSFRIGSAVLGSTERARSGGRWRGGGRADW